MQPVVIIGGGISGLAAAHRVVELAREQALAVEVLLLEASDRLGGVIASERRDGFLIEGGPESFITDKPWALALCERLGLGGQLIGTNDAYRRSFVAFRGRLVPIPVGFQVLAPARLRALAATPLLSPGGKLRMALELILPRRQAPGDESLGRFVERRFGREALERLAEPLIAGIYGARAHDLSLDATLPRFRKMETEHGSVIRALRARRRAGPPRSGNGVSGARYGLFVTLRDGMQTLTDTLAARLPPGSVQLGARVVRVEMIAASSNSNSNSDPKESSPSSSSIRQRGRYRLQVDDGPPLTADAVCLAVPAYAAGELVQEFDPALAGLLKSIPYGSSGTLNLAYRREDVPHPLDGFGFVVPRAEERTIIGCTFAHVKFPGRAPDGMALLRVFLGGATAEREDLAVIQAVRDDLRFYLGITQEPLWSALRCWPRSMPRYPVGHLDRLREIETRLAAHPGLFLAGNAYRGIGIPDAIHSAETAAEGMMQLPQRGL
jgi:oxygen-dependent protoporphyrinogen oxidase